MQFIAQHLSLLALALGMTACAAAPKAVSTQPILHNLDIGPKLSNHIQALPYSATPAGTPNSSNPAKPPKSPSSLPNPKPPADGYCSANNLQTDNQKQTTLQRHKMKIPTKTSE